jgi:hypothetical protein
MLNSEITSRISSTIKTNSKDGRLSRRLILSIAESKAKFLISQKLNDKSLHREQNLYQTVSCIELVDENIIKCPIIEFRSCRSLKRSKNKLPELIHSRYGHSLKEVLSLDEGISFMNITPTQYRLNKSRSLKVKNNYFYVKDGYLYLPDSKVIMVTLNILTQDLYELNESSNCKDGDCKSVWDYEFICPDKLIEVVIQETIKELSVTKQIQEDGNPNMNPNG